MCLKAFFKTYKVMVKTTYDKVDVLIAVGATAFSKAIDLTRGTCKGVKFIPFPDAATRDHAIDISVTSNDGTKILGKTDYRDFAHAGGSYRDSFKPCNFDTKAQIKTDVLADKVIATANFVGQLIFLIEEDCN